LVTPFRLLLFFSFSFFFILGLGSPTLQPDGSITWQAVIRMHQNFCVTIQIFYSKISTLGYCKLLLTPQRKDPRNLLLGSEHEEQSS
jgi:hypothetical protein